MFWSRYAILSQQLSVFFGNVTVVRFIAVASEFYIC